MKIEFSVFYSKDYGSTRAYESNKTTDDPEKSNKARTTKSFMLFYLYCLFFLDYLLIEKALYSGFEAYIQLVGFITGSDIGGLILFLLHKDKEEGKKEN